MFYDAYMRICEANGVSPTRVLSDLGISKSSYGHWREGGEPLNETKKKIAQYFKISIEDLKDGKIKKPTDNRELSEEDQNVLDDMRQLSYEDRAFVAALIAKLKRGT